MQILLYITFVWLLLRLFMALKNWWDQPFLEKVTKTTVANKVSVLIPARNEAHRLPALLGDLQNAGNAVKEVVVLDDGSTDHTSQVVKDFQGAMPHLRLMAGSELPNGWLGKNWACHQLAEEATGDYLLFLDADVRLKPGAIEKAMAALQQENATLLSVFGRQEMKTFGEKAVVPLVPYILVTQLPLQWVKPTKNSSLAAANGQFMLFDAGIYKQNHWHKQVKDSRAEDIDIAKQIKKARHKSMALLSRQLVECRMYGGFREGMNGFAKNFPAFFLNNWLLGFGFAFMTGLVYGLLAFNYPFPALFMFLVEVAILRGVVARLGGLPLGMMLLLAPVHMATVMILAIFAVFKHLFKNQQWKGRPI